MLACYARFLLLIKILSLSILLQLSFFLLGCYKQALKQPRVLREWEDMGQAKVVFKCEEEKEL